MARFAIGKALARLRKPGGVFYFSNIGIGNPYRCWAEYVSDWVLIERDELRVRSLLSEANALIGDIRLHHDPEITALLAAYASGHRSLSPAFATSGGIRAGPRRTAANAPGQRRRSR